MRDGADCFPRHKLREGKAYLARRVIAPVLYDADETPDKIRAQSLFAMKDMAAHP